MITIVFVLTISIVAYWVLGCHARVVAWRRARRMEVLRSQLQSADRRIAREHIQTRRAMNDAAGQSWRNLAE